MPIIQTADLRQGHYYEGQQQIYNGLDCCLTLEVWEELQRLGNSPPEMYTYERAMQGPLLEMMLRGFLVDKTELRLGQERIRAQLAQLDSILQQYAFAVWGKSLNPRSQKQLQDFFYTRMRLPEIWTSKKGERKLSMDRETLEKLELYFHARPIVACILAIRDLSKQLEVLETEIDLDGRMRTSYNIAGTETWRLSSSSNAYGTGGNLQNITPHLRRMFIADPGKKLCVIDLEQAESRDVGLICGVLFGDWSYLDACESGDLHTLTARLIWPNEPWTGDPAKDRAIADAPFYRHFSRRDMSKRGGHGSNYYGTPWTMSRHLKVPQRLMDDFQRAYFHAFPGIPRWHRHVAAQLQTSQALVGLFGQTRHFFGRPNDDTTLREAIAFDPQSSVAIRTNLGLYRVWDARLGELLAQTHDSITFQYPEEDEAEIVPQALRLMEIPLRLAGRTQIIPGEAKIGWNWGNYAGPEDVAKAKSLGRKPPTLNLDGLKKWKGSDTRKRSSRLDRVLS